MALLVLEHALASGPGVLHRVPVPRIGGQIYDRNRGIGRRFVEVVGDGALSGGALDARPVGFVPLGFRPTRQIETERLRGGIQTVRGVPPEAAVGRVVQVVAGYGQATSIGQGGGIGGAGGGRTVVGKDAAHDVGVRSPSKFVRGGGNGCAGRGRGRRWTMGRVIEALEGWRAGSPIEHVAPPRKHGGKNERRVGVAHAWAEASIRQSRETSSSAERALDAISSRGQYAHAIGVAKKGSERVP